MGCWFACLRFRAEQRTPLSSVDATPCKSRDRSMSRKQLASVFTPEEKGSPCEGDAVQDSVHRELKHEANFLKSCGALLDTPAEFKNPSPKTNIQQKNQDDIPNNSHFLLRHSSCKKLRLDEQLEEAPHSPASRPKECLADSIHDMSPSRKQQIVRTYSNIVHSGTPVSRSLAAEIRARSVRFDVVQNGTGVESDMDAALKSTPQSGNRIHSPSSKYSPYPTPLKLTDEMETPGTVYPAKVENYGFGNNVWIRSQYIFPVLNPMLNRSQRKATNEVPRHLGQSVELPEQQVQDRNSPDGEPNLQSSLSSASADSALPQSDKPTNLKDNRANGQPASPDNVRLNAGNESTRCCLDGHSSGIEQEEASSGRSTLVVSGFSQWSETTDQHEGRINCEAAARRRSPVSGSPDRDRPIIGTVAAYWNSEESIRAFGQRGINCEAAVRGRSPVRSPERDRPIIGTVAAHWNSEESTRVSPKVWDGNGIPNSTNKYKEDQRVSWHATPFEERLEKALSDEKLHPRRRRLNGKPTELEEGDEERDTATS